MRFKNYQQFNEGIEDLFRSAHAAIDPEELMPLEDLIGQPRFPSHEEFDAAVDYLEIDPEHLYYNPKDFISPIMYWDGPIYEPFHGGLNMEALKMMRVKDRLAYKIKETKKMLDSKNYSSLFSMMDKKILIPSFIKMYEEIPDKDKYEIFKDLYVRSEYGFQSFPVEVITDCFSKRKLSPEWKKRIKEFETVAKKNPDGTVTLYRGENVDSAKSDDAFSWTLDKKTAKFFADRFSKGSGRIVEKTVDPKQVIDYLDNRGESEVILFPKKFGTLRESKGWLNESLFDNIDAGTIDYNFYIYPENKDYEEVEVKADEERNFAVFKSQGSRKWEARIDDSGVKLSGISEVELFKFFKSLESIEPGSSHLPPKWNKLPVEVSLLFSNVLCIEKWWDASHEKYKNYLSGTKFGL